MKMAIQILIFFSFMTCFLKAENDNYIFRHYSKFYGRADKDSIFIKYKAPNIDSKTFRGLIYNDSTPIFNLNIATYVKFDKEGRVYNIKFDRLYNLSSSHLKDKFEVWQMLEEAIKKASEDWIAKPILIKDIDSTASSKIAEKQWGLGRQWHMIIFTFTDFDFSIDKFYWIYNEY